MSYEEFVYVVFREDNDGMGIQAYGDDELEDIIAETPFHKIEKYLLNKGYDLQYMYRNQY